jgi:aspartate carbamoyltransferase regulatory subunit
MSENVGDDKLRIVKIHDGTVIDHIRAGKSLEVLKMLGITGDDGHVVSLAMNISSGKIEKKDIVKVEHRFLKDEEVARIALVAPEATINHIENGRLINKYCVELPEIITDIMRCPNQRCVTNKEREPIHSKYQVISQKPIQLKCLYCWTIVEEEHIISEFTS